MKHRPGGIGDSVPTAMSWAAKSLPQYGEPIDASNIVTDACRALTWCGISVESSKVQICEHLKSQAGDSDAAVRTSCIVRSYSRIPVGTINTFLQSFLGILKTPSFLLKCYKNLRGLLTYLKFIVRSAAVHGGPQRNILSGKKRYGSFKLWSSECCEEDGKEKHKLRG